MTDMRVTLRLSATDEGVREAVHAVAAEVRQVNDALRQGKPAGEASAQGSRVAARGYAEVGAEAKFAGAALSQLKAAVVAYASFEGLRRVAQTADAYANQAAKIRLATDSQTEFNAAQKATFEIAQRTSQQLGSTVSLYARIAGAMRGTGMEQSRLLQLTETINQAFAVSGATAAEASAATIQLSQAFAAGALRGEEFNSVNEQAPRIMQAIADSLGVTRGALKEMATEGKLTSDVLIKALSGIQAGKIAEEFTELPLTIERAFTQLENALTRYIGEADQANGYSVSLAESLQSLAQNLDTVAQAVEALSVLIMARLVGVAIPAAITGLRAMATQALLTATTMEGMMGGAALTRMALFTAGIAGIGRALMALAGGPVGVAALALYALYQGWEALQDSIEERQRGPAIVQEMAEAMRQMAENSGGFERSAEGLEQMGAELEKTRALAKAGYEELTKAEERLATARDSFSIGKDAQYYDRLHELEQLVADLTAETHRLIQANADAAAAIDKQKASLDAYADSARAAQGAIDALTNNTQSLIDRNTSLEKKLKALRLGDAIVQVDTAREKFTAALSAIGERSTKEMEATGSFGDVVRNTLSSVTNAWGQYDQARDLIAKNDALEKQLEREQKAMRGGKKATDEAAKALAEWSKEVEAMASSPLVDKAAEEALKIGLAIEEAAKKGRTDLVVLLNRALEKLGTTINKDKVEAVAAANSFKQMLDPVQELMRSYQEEAALIGMTDDQRRIHTATMQAEAEARRALDEAVQRGKVYTDEERESIIETAKARAQYNVALQRSADESKVYTDIIRRGWLSIGDLVGDVVRGSIKSFSDFGKRLGDLARNMVADMIAEFLKLKVLQPMLQGLFSGGGGGGGFWGSIAAGAATLFGGGGGGSSAGITGSLLSAGSQSVASGAGASGTGGGAGMWGSLLSGGTGQSALQYGYGLAAGTTWGGGFLSGVAEGTAGFIGPPQALAATQPAGYGAGQAFAQYAPMVAGVAGAAYGFTNSGSSNGSLGSIAGAAGYGALGVAGAGAALGALSGTGAIAGATGAFASLGAAAWIPVVGWILAIAALVDMVSGGKLFGTRYKPDNFTSTIGIDNEGGTATLVRQDSRQRALFGGIRRRTVSMAPTEEMETAAGQLYNAVHGAVTTVERTLGTELTELITGAFTQVYDKKGKLKEEFATVLGRRYNEDFETFAKRLIAENVIATVDAAMVGFDEAGQTASQIAERWRHSVDALNAGSQLLVAIAKDIIDGRALLGDGATLENTVELVEEYNTANESLVQTYARLVTATAALQTAIDLSGVTMTQTGEALVRLAADIADAAGGIDAASSLWSRFFQGFYSDQELLERQVSILRGSVTSQLAGLGLDADITLEEFRDAFTAALPSLSADQVVQWLRAGDSLLSLTEALAQLEGMVPPTVEAVRQLGGAFYETMFSIIASADQATEAAQAQGATTARLGLIHLEAARRMAQAVAILRAQTQDLIAQLYGGMAGSLEAINAQIALLEQTTEPATQQVEDLGGAIDDTMDRWMRGLESIKSFLDGLLVNNNLTTLTPEQQLAEAARQYQAALAAAQGGDVGALENLPELAQQYLELARSFWSSGDQYQAIFDAVRASLGGLAGLPIPGTGGNPADPGAGPVVVLEPSEELRALYEQRDALLAEQEGAYRAQLALQLAQNLRDLAGALQVSVLELATGMGVNLEELAADLGVKLEELNGESVQALAVMAAALGVSLTELTGGLGITLADLAGGVAELATQVGINLQDLTTESVRGLAELANSLGVELSELAQSLGVDLGALADSQSLLNDALEAQINALPEAQRDQLAPLLAAVEDAVGEADANNAIFDLEGAVRDLSPELRDLFAPFFDNIDPSQLPPDVAQLIAANDWLELILAATDSVREAIFGLGSASNPVEPPDNPTGVSGAVSSSLYTGGGEALTLGVPVSPGAATEQAMLAEIRAMRASQEAAARVTERELTALRMKVADLERAEQAALVVQKEWKDADVNRRR